MQNEINSMSIPTLNAQSSELNPRQWHLYNLLKTHSKRFTTYMSKETIVTLLKKDYEPDFKQTEHNSSAFAMLRADVKAINESFVIKKIVVSNSDGYRLGTKEEATQFTERYFKKLCKGMSLYWHLIKDKYQKDGQGVLVQDKSKAHEFIESFINQESANQIQEN
jgi:hypothetical protein